MSDLSRAADKLGVFASTTCALHCLLVPALLVGGTTLPTAFLEDEFFHSAILFLVLPSAIVAFGLGCWRHKDPWVLGLGCIGLMGIFAAALLHDALGENGERFVTLASAMLLISAHIRNYRLCRSTDCDDD